MHKNQQSAQPSACGHRTSFKPEDHKHFLCKLNIDLSKVLDSDSAL